MPHISWTIQLNAATHTIRLEHSSISGIRKIWIDDHLQERGKSLIDYGSFHSFSIEDARFDLYIVTNGIKYYYYLLKNYQPIPSDKDQRKGKSSSDLLRTRHLADLPFWLELTRLLNLRYEPRRDGTFDYRHRIVGIWKGYPVLIMRSFPQNGVPAGYVLIVHHSPITNEETLGRIRSDERIFSLLGKFRKSKQALEIGVDFSVLVLPVIKKESVEETAVRIRYFFSVVSNFASAFPFDTCENKYCPRGSREVKLILLNGYPQLYCSDCLNKIPGWGDQAKENYQKAPLNLLQGLIAGLGVTFFSVFLFAAAGVLIDRLISIVGPFAFVWIIKSMDQVGTKRSLLSIVLATLMSLLSVFLGLVSIYFLIGIRLGQPFSFQNLLSSFEAILSNPNKVISIIVLVGIFVLIYAIWFWYQQRKELSRAFKPSVEIIAGA